ncbi:hypothetical protein ACIQ7Q_17715 [Streptomyces sp. NPDC096176]
MKALKTAVCGDATCLVSHLPRHIGTSSEGRPPLVRLLEAAAGPP